VVSGGHWLGTKRVGLHNCWDAVFTLVADPKGKLSSSGGIRSDSCTFVPTFHSGKLAQLSEFGSFGARGTAGKRFVDVDPGVSVRTK
jgi:hypothetical protein